MSLKFLQDIVIEMKTLVFLLLLKNLLDAVVISYGFHLRGKFFGSSRVNLVCCNYKKWSESLEIELHLDRHLDPFHLLRVEDFLGDGRGPSGDPACQTQWGALGGGMQQM